jgi:hypothetical protein
MSRLRRITGYSLIGLTLLLALGLLLPEGRQVPVQGADSNDWHPQTFWYHPLGPVRSAQGRGYFCHQRHAGTGQ